MALLLLETLSLLPETS
uniref:Uncharacterized protein n=1 Tax=Anguilla anguilla TaxID=7936 RepID=A0A0E9UV02_ANGAN